jgi:hypothetical protein
VDNNIASGMLYTSISEYRLRRTKVPRTKTPTFKCPKCDQTFAMAMHLGRHMTTKHGQAPKKATKKPAKAPTPEKTPQAAKPVTGGLAEQLGSLITQLQAQRQEHVQALAEIDAVFAQLGLQPQAAKRRGRPPKAQAAAAKIDAPAAPQAQAADRMIGAPAAKPRGKRKRRKFSTSGTEAILTFVKGGGAKGRTSAEINKQWKQEGRSGNAYVQIGQLTKAKKLKKEDLKGQRGSRYTAV